MKTKLLLLLLGLIAVCCAQNPDTQLSEADKKAARHARLEKLQAELDAGEKLRAEIWKMKFPEYLQGASAENVGSGSGTISGQVFIVTRGGNNIKLGLVRVRVLGISDLAALGVWLGSEEVNNTWKEAERKIESLPVLYRSNMRVWLEAKKWTLIWSRLPVGEMSTLTDADGKFTLTGLPISYMLVATATRAVGANEEHYVWTLPADKLSGQQPVLLSNHNTTPL